MRFLIAVVAVLLLTFSPVYAQAPQPCPDPCEVKAGTPLSVGFTHPGSDTTGFRIYLREGTGPEVKVGADLLLTVLQAGAAVVPLGTLSTSGDYFVSVSAFNSFFETKSAAYKFTVVGPPPAPGQPRIFYVAVSLAADGRLELRVVDAPPAK